ncbi:YhcH/YjgK/YiaL family protein [Psittacicella hinzii]|uniref:YhcH/YjgK/YiaL family protein n=1 Tax=Psittacicella hinzii TaxID=2028575 RepID=A0A3A1YCB5_9GAMM|nr:YhcH/YjgK/YiaL family protein [Psittacicella hinzii]RIY35016.1 hypothetical protein CKF58_07220 [Psittacicella hinzii]
MKFFSATNLNHAFPHQPLMRELIEVIYTYYQATKEQKPSKRVETFTELFNNYDALNLTQKVSATLRSIAAQEHADLDVGEIPALLNKVIFNELEGNNLDLARTEYHFHTYDIHIVFANKETYIYLLEQVPEQAHKDQDPEPLNDTEFAYDLQNLTQVTLLPGQGVIIPPSIAHFAGFKGQANQGNIVKCVVKIDARYAQELNLA